MRSIATGRNRHIMLPMRNMIRSCFYFMIFINRGYWLLQKNYRNLSPVSDDDDLLQIGFLRTFQALVKYDHAEHIAMKFSTSLEWSIRNVFQRVIGYSDKFVEIYNRNGQLYLTLSDRIKETIVWIIWIKNFTKVFREM